MRLKSNFCGDVERRSKVLSFGKTQINLFFRSLTRTFATVFILTTTVTIASCSQDDDYYDSDMYTLAEKMETRSGGDPGGGNEGGQGNGYTPPIMEIEAGGDTCYYDISDDVTLEVLITWNQGIWAFVQPQIDVRFKDNIYENEVYTFELYNSHTICWASSHSVEGAIKYKKTRIGTGSFAIYAGEFEEEVEIRYVGEGGQDGEGGEGGEGD